MTWRLIIICAVSACGLYAGQAQASTGATARNSAFRSLVTSLYRTGTTCINDEAQVTSAYGQYQSGAIAPGVLTDKAGTAFADCLSAERALRDRFGDNADPTQAAPHLPSPLRSSVSVQRLVWDWQSTIADSANAALNAQLYVETEAYGRDVAYRALSTAASNSLVDAFKTEWRIERAWGLTTAA